MGTDIISQSFNDLLNSEPVDGGGFYVEPMNKCIEDAHLLPPLIPLYPADSRASARPSLPCRLPDTSPSMTSGYYTWTAR